MFSNINFHENPSYGSRIAPCGHTDGHADIAWITVAFRNFANAPDKNIYVPRVGLYSTRNVTKAKLCIVEYMSSVCTTDEITGK